MSQETRIYLRFFMKPLTRLSGARIMKQVSASRCMEPRFGTKKEHWHLKFMETDLWAGRSSPTCRRSDSASSSQRPLATRTRLLPCLREAKSCTVSRLRFCEHDKESCMVPSLNK